MSSTIEYRGSDVLDPEQRLIGTIDDVVYDEDGHPIWAVVELGLMRSAHYVPVAGGYLAETGTFVIPYDKRTVKAAPKARRDHVLDRTTETQLIQHYELSSDGGRLGVTADTSRFGNFSSRRWFLPMS